MLSIAVPYISQWDDTAKASRGDCGIVSACMIANWRGIQVTPDEMLQRARLPVGRHSYTFAQIMQAARAVGLKLDYHRPAKWEEIEAELKHGRPVITLLKYGEIPNNLDDFIGAHFWVVVGVDGDHVLVNDPDWWHPRREEGYMRRVPLVDFNHAIGEPLKSTGNMPYQSLFVSEAD